MDGNLDQAPAEQGVGGDHQGGAQEAQFFARGAENKISVLLGNEAQFGEQAVHQAGAPEAPRADAHLALQQVIAAAEGIFGGIQEQHQPIALVLLEAVHPELGGDHGEEHLHAADHRQPHPFPGEAAPGQPAHQRNPGQQGPGEGARQDRRQQGGQQQDQPGQWQAGPKKHHQHDGSKHQGGAQIGLDENQEPGHTDQAERTDQIDGPFHRMARQHPRQQQDGPELGEFGGLHVEAGDADPALGPKG